MFRQKTTARPVKGFWLAGFIALAILIASPSGALAWVELTPMNTAREQFAAAVVNGKIFVLGGRDTNGNLLSSMEIYDPVANTWTLVPNAMDRGLSGLTAAVVNNVIYFFGGFELVNNSLLPMNFARSYDPALDVWNDLAPRDPRFIPTALNTAVAHGGHIYLFGGELRAVGQDGGEPFSQISPIVRRYTPANDSWLPLNPMPWTTSKPAVAAVGDTIYLMGGDRLDNINGMVSWVAAYNVTANTWDVQTPADLPRPNSYTASSAAPVLQSPAGAGPGVRRQIFLFGGRTLLGRYAAKDVIVYDPLVNAGWNIAPMTAGTHGFFDNMALTSTGGPEGYTVYIGGGRDGFVAADISNALWAHSFDMANGIMPGQAVPDDADLNQDGTFDNLQPLVIKSVKTLEANQMMGVDVRPANKDRDLDKLDPIEVAMIQPARLGSMQDPQRRFPWGLLTFTLDAPPGGVRWNEALTIRVYTSFDLPSQKQQS
ncbi:MAG: kelch repeat-containing protein [Desulfatibacillaceae bacterium]|nr:kelch repeat-containing protein [Desulfatibacillaceae bacterium]